MRNLCNKRKTCIRGFTLLEVLISISILAIIAVLIGSGFNISLNAWDKGEKETDETQRLRILSAMLTQQIKSAFPYKTGDGSESDLFFKGESDSLAFVTTLADSLSGGFKWVKYYYRDDILYYMEGVLPDKELEESLSSDAEELDSELGIFKFEYYSAKEGQWYEKWEPGESMPSAVRITISFFQPFTVALPMGQKKDKKDGPGL